MTLRARFLAGENSTSPSPPEVETVDSDFVVILAALLCALICVLGLVAVARCAWIRRLSGRATLGPPPSTANKGLKKKVLKSLPKLTYPTGEASKFTECPICLTEFVAGDDLRVLPHCGHGFHLRCIDTWLGSHSSCPSCRQILVAVRCKKCGELPASSAAGATGTATRSTQIDHQVNTCLP